MMDNDWQRGAEGHRIDVRRGARPEDVEFAIGKTSALFAAFCRAYVELKENCWVPVEIDDMLNEMADCKCVLDDRWLSAKFRLQDE